MWIFCVTGGENYAFPGICGGLWEGGGGTLTISVRRSEWLSNRDTIGFCSTAFCSENNFLNSITFSHDWLNIISIFGWRNNEDCLEQRVNRSEIRLLRNKIDVRALYAQKQNGCMSDEYSSLLSGLDDPFVRL